MGGLVTCWTPNNAGLLLGFEISVSGSSEVLPFHTSPNFLKMDCTKNIPDHRESTYLKALALPCDVHALGKGPGIFLSGRGSLRRGSEILSLNPSFSLGPLLSASPCGKHQRQCFLTRHLSLVLPPQIITNTTGFQRNHPKALATAASASTTRWTPSLARWPARLDSASPSYTGCCPVS